MHALPPTIIPLDTMHLGRAEIICCYLVRGTVNILIDPGPTVVLPAVAEALAVHGLTFDDIGAIVLTHIHLDHGGSAGTLLNRYPHMTLYVHERALTHLVDQLRQIRTSRASPALVEGIRVDYYGTPSPISQVAQISVPEPRQLAIKPFDAAMLKEIEKAIQKSDLGVTPQSDGKILRLTMPPLSGDQRKKYAARVKDLAEEARVSLRNSRRDENKRADALFKDSKMTAGCTETARLSTGS